jgi:lysyl-tRNA synthetase class 2
MAYNERSMNGTKVSYSSADTQREIRIEKMNKLKALGIDPFTPNSHRDLVLSEVKGLFKSGDERIGKDEKNITLAGRIKSKRVSGKIAFATVEDESLPEGFQFIFKRDILDGEALEVVDAAAEVLDSVEGVEAATVEVITAEEKKLGFADFKELFDEGDYIQATGFLDHSQSGEPSLFVQEYTILTKALRPLPEEIADVEQKYRQRYLDMRLHPEVREMFKMKSRFWAATREFMVNEGFLELQAPTMEETTGGAEAAPFVTHHNALDEDYYLRISSELHLKRYIVGGFEKVFDIDKNFRNEGIDDEHLQEITQMEFYWAYANNDNLLDFCEKLIKHVIIKTFNTYELEKDGKIVDWSKPWPRIKYYDFIEQYSGIKLAEYETVEKLKALADTLGVHYEAYATKGRLIDQIYKKVARPKCIEPIWLTDIPVELSPLAKREPKNPALTQRSHLLAYGSELSNGFSELNDPIDQLARFEEQQAAREAGDDEAMMIDLDYVNALEIAMPPTAGFAYSERLFSVLMQKPIRECTAFPLMKRLEKEKVGKDKKTLVAHSVILNTPEIPTWSKMNAAAHLGASFAAREGKKLIKINTSHSRDGEEIPMNIQHAIVMKQAKTSQDLLELKIEAEAAGLTVSCFTKEMRDSKNDEEANDRQESKEIENIEFLGILVFGKKGDVECVTEKFERME